MNAVRKRCKTCNSLRDCGCKGRAPGGVVFVKAGPVPAHLRHLTPQGRTMALKREQQQQTQPCGASYQAQNLVTHAQSSSGLWGISSPPKKGNGSACLPSAQLVHAPPKFATLGKAELSNGPSMQHLTAEGRRAALRRQQAEQQPRGAAAVKAGGGGAPRRSSSNNTNLEHESIRLRHVEQQHREKDAESSLAEQRARQQKFEAEQQQQRLVEARMQALIMNPSPDDPNAVNTALARSIASKQSGASVGHIFSAGYGYE